MTESDYHEPVMVREAIEALHLSNKLHFNNQARYIDATVGTGGHLIEITKAGGEILGIDMDLAMLEVAKNRLGKEKGSAKFVRGNFRDIDKIAQENGFRKVAGVLFDLGVSNIHLKSENRGFSFENPKAPLDMRLNDEALGVKASDLLNVLREDQLTDLFLVTLDKGSATWLARKVVETRAISPFVAVADFLRISQNLRRKPGLNPSTLAFLALRIAVNSELENLKEALPKAFDLLAPGGRLVVISFHSGEDRIVKNFFRNKENEARILTEKPLVPSKEEIARNPKSRSAKMRVLEKM